MFLNTKNNYKTYYVLKTINYKRGTDRTKCFFSFVYPTWYTYQTGDLKHSVLFIINILLISNIFFVLLQSFYKNPNILKNSIRMPALLNVASLVALSPHLRAGRRVLLCKSLSVSISFVLFLYWHIFHHTTVKSASNWSMRRGGSIVHQWVGGGLHR